MLKQQRAILDDLDEILVSVEEEKAKGGTMKDLPKQAVEESSQKSQDILDSMEM
eukprot:gene10155-17440_t